MLNFSNSKVLTIYITFILISIFSLTNFLNFESPFLKKKINLGLDLQGGSYLLLEVDSSALEKRRLQSKVILLKKALNKSLIKFDNFSINDDSIKFTTEEKNFKEFEKIFNLKGSNEINAFLDKYNSFELDYTIKNNLISIYLSKYGIINLRSAAVDQSIEIVRRRIDEIGTKEPSILKRGNILGKDSGLDKVLDCDL